ncbi:ABC transporter permease subunit [Proteinivorax tanatarense]|uniref:ABC transporter permease subunit n=1 Tax=Proteinivorax tanatarense TaxID=1260629 RepID=A0AAU7VJ45_9FIRM
MGGTIKFEVKKLMKRKKLVWLLIVITAVTAGVYYQNISQFSKVKHQILAEIGTYSRSIGIQQEEFAHIRNNREFTEKEAELYQHSQDMLRTLFQWRRLVAGKWRIAWDHREWDDILASEAEFYEELEAYEKLGGAPLEYFQGVDKEIAISKNAWLRENDMFYEDEIYPDSPHLNLIQSSSFLFGIAGVLILVLFFGAGVSDEKDEGTWGTLKTQPIPIWKIIVSKYISLSVIIIIFLVMVMVVGIILPAIFSDYSIKLNYPQVLKSDDSFIIIPTSMYLLRASFFFSFVSFFAFSIAMIPNKLCKNAFTTIILTSLILLTGYFLTDWISPLQHAINPFYHFYYNLLAHTPKLTDLVFPIILVVWSSLLILLAIYLPEKQLSFLYTSNIKKPFIKGQTSSIQLKKWNIAVFQWRKIVRKGLLLKAFGLLILVVLFIYSTISKQAGEVELTYINMLEEKKDIIQLEKIPEAKESKKISLENAYDEVSYYAAKNEWNVGIEYLNLKHEKLESAVEGYNQGNWVPLYEYQLFDIKSSAGKIETGRAKAIVEQRGNPAQFSTKVGLEETNLLLKKDINPIFLPQNQIPNIFEHSSKERSQFLKENHIQMVDSNGLFILYHYFERYIFFLPLVIFIFILGGGFASEKGKKSTFALLKTQPLSEKNLFLGELISSKIAIVSSCILFFLIAMVVSTVGDRFGDWNYPILRYDPEAIVCADDYAGTEVFVSNWNRGFHFVSLARHLAESLGLFIALALFFTAITNVLALFIKHKVGVMTLTTIIGVLGYQFTQFLRQTAHISPFTYLNIHKVVSGEYATLLNNPKVNLINGIILLLGLTVLLILVGYIILTKPHIRIRRFKSVDLERTD